MTKAVGYELVCAEMIIRNVSIGELAKRLHIHQDTLRRKLRGDSALTLREAFAIRRALGADMPLETLFVEAMEK